jgi:hypothetical protein
MFTQNQPMIDRLLNTEYAQYMLNRSGAEEESMN